MLIIARHTQALEFATSTFFEVKERQVEVAQLDRLSAVLIVGIHKLEGKLRDVDGRSALDVPLLEPVMILALGVPQTALVGTCWRGKIDLPEFAVQCVLICSIRDVSARVADDEPQRPQISGCVQVATHVSESERLRFVDVGPESAHV